MHILHRLGLTPPTPFLQNAVKHSPGRGWGLLARQPYCHTFSCHSFLFPLGGNAVRFLHFVFFVSASVSFAIFCFSSFLRVAFLKKLSGGELLFLGGLCWFCVFWWVFAIVFALFFGVSLPNCLERFYRCQVWFLCLWVCSLFLRFFFVVVVVLGFFLRDIDQVVTGHPLHTHLLFWFFFFFVSRRFSLFRPFWPCVPLLGVFPGCHSGPRAVLGFSLHLWGLSLLARPFRGPFLGTRGGKGFLFFFCLVFFFPFLFCGHTFSSKPE